jgi:transcription antitermination factor NusG
MTSSALASKGYAEYLPLYRVKRRRPDRIVTIELPLLPGYVFCRFDPRCRLPIVSTPGVCAIVCFGEEPAPIPESELEAVQMVLNSGLEAGPCPFLKEGQRIRVKHGSLEGLEGILLKKKSEWRLVVSLTMLQRSVAVEIDCESIVTV